MSESKRWVKLSPEGSEECSLLLAKAANREQERNIGNQTGEGFFYFCIQMIFGRDYDQYIKNGIRFIKDPVTEEYGTVAVFEDLYGNLWDLIEPAKK